MSDAALFPTRALPAGSMGQRASGWFGVWCVVVTEAAIFAYLIFGYFYFASQPHPGGWPPGGPPRLTLAGPNTLILLASSVALWWGERGLRRHGRKAQTLIGLAVALVLGCVFVAVQLLEWKAKDFGPTTNAYGSFYFTLTGFHLAHVAAGLVTLLVLLIWSALGYFNPERHAPIAIGAIYWHFVDAVWLVVFATLYLTPYLG
jgi:cytochrome c oxidase subunit 3